MGLVGPARASALGDATTALRSDVGSHANPAAAATRARPVVLLFARQGFGLDELRYGGLHGVWPFSLGSVSVGASSFGFDAYRETYFVVGGARSLSPGTSRPIYLGATLRYVTTSITGYGTAGELSASIGGIVPLLPTLDFGVHLANLAVPAFSRTLDVPRALAVGLAYQASPDFTVVTDVFKDIDFPLSVRSGFEYRPVNAFIIRTGVSTQPTTFAVGAGVRVGALHADLAAEQHLDLGWTPSIALSFRW